MRTEDKSKLVEWMGIELVLLVNRKIEWENIFGEIKYGISISDTDFREMELNSEKRINGEAPDYWFIGNQNQHSTPIRLLTAEIKMGDSESIWLQDKLEGKGYEYKEVEYLIYKKSKIPPFSKRPNLLGVMVN
jgi:hypothetical protein